MVCTLVEHAPWCFPGVPFWSTSNFNHNHLWMTHKLNPILWTPGWWIGITSWVICKSLLNRQSCNPLYSCSKNLVFYHHSHNSKVISAMSKKSCPKVTSKKVAIIQSCIGWHYEWKFLYEAVFGRGAFPSVIHKTPGSGVGDLPAERYPDLPVASWQPKGLEFYHMNFTTTYDIRSLENGSKVIGPSEKKGGFTWIYHKWKMYSKQIWKFEHTWYQMARNIYIYIIILSALSLLFHLHPPNLVPMSTMSLVFVVICLWMQKVTSSCASTWFPGVLCDSVLEAQAITVILLMEKEIRRSPVEVNSLSHFLQGLYIPGGCLGFLNHQQ